MRFFQSERRLSRELKKILAAPKEKWQTVERRTLSEEEEFVVYLPSDLIVDETDFHHFQVRDGSEVVLRL